MGFGFLGGGAHHGAVLADHRTGDHFHGAVGTGHNAGFAADAAFLHHQHHAIGATDSAIGADIGTGSVLTLAAQHGGADVNAFDHMQAWGEAGGVER
ncbi:hypothetical protein D3C87_1995280 [compost metagenome]